MKRSAFVVFTVIFIFSMTFLTACDPIFQISGMAYEWVNAPAGATSTIYVSNVVLGKDVEPTLRSMQNAIPNNVSRVPLGNVEIAVWDEKTIETSRFKTSSNVTGEIHAFWVGTPGYRYRVQASRAGYSGAHKDISLKQGDGNPVIVVLLVREQR